MSRIQSIVFDLDGVLLDSFDANLEYFQHLMRTAGYPEPTREQYTKLFDATSWDVIKSFTGLSDDNDIRKIWDLSQRLEYESKVPYKLSPGVSEVIPGLSKEYSLAIVTSTTREYVFDNPLAKYKDCFSAVIAYEDTVGHKPDPEPLLAATRALKSNAHDCLYIGDGQSDIEAGKAAGIAVLTFGAVPLPGSMGSITTFFDLPKVIESLND